MSEPQEEKYEDSAVKLLVAKTKQLCDDAFRQGWARGYEQGFVNGVAAATDTKPKVTLD